VAIVGLGKLGQSLARALVESGAVEPGRLVGTARHEATLERGRALGIRVTSDNRAAVKGAAVVLLAVKPQVLPGVLRELRPVLTARQLLISTAAGSTLASIEKAVGKAVPVVRTMPNVPCQVRAGMTALSPGRHARPRHLELARAIFEAVGRTRVLEEKYLDAVTGLSGSGPAFMYVVLEALAEGGLKVGLPREIATELVAQTMLGAAQLALETGEHPAKLKDAVLTPAGCTIDGLLELEQGGLRVALIRAVVRAAERARDLPPD
jgi:pyrroline-5-carboxylate reductase